MPKVSWLIPVYNAGSFLEPALASVQAQTFKDFEAIVIDDGSTDGSSDVIRKVCAGDRRFTYLHKPNSGIVDTLNDGLVRCRGEFIARMDGDDLCEPSRLATQIAYLDDHSDCVAVGSRVTVINASGAVVRHSAGTRWKRPGPGGFPPRAITITHPTLVMRAQALRAIKGYRRGFLAAEDYDLLFRLAREGRIIELPDYLLRYRVHSGSESATKIGRQRISCLKAEISAYLSTVGASDAVLAALPDEAPLEELCTLANQLGNGLPNAAVLRAYYAAEYLRRATYRLPTAQARAAAATVAMRLLTLLPQAPTAHYFIIFAVRELLHWMAVSASGRNVAPPDTT